MINVEYSRIKLESCDRQIGRLSEEISKIRLKLLQNHQRRSAHRIYIRALGRQVKTNPEDTNAQSKLEKAHDQSRQAKQLYGKWMRLYYSNQATLAKVQNQRKRYYREILEWS